MVKVSVIIPVFNEAATCREVLEAVAARKVPGAEFEIIVVESNSPDGSREIVRAFCEKHRNTVAVYEERPGGKGRAVREGLARATGDILMIQDADLEYDFNDYERLLAPLIRGERDVVLGSRHAGGSSWRIRNYGVTGFATAFFINFGHLLFTWIFNLLYGQKLTDPATMFKIFRRECIEGIQFKCSRFDFDFELICKLVRRGYKPLEIPVTYKSRGFDAGKKVRIFRDPPTWVRVLVRCRFESVGAAGPKSRPVPGAGRKTA